MEQQYYVGQFTASQRFDANAQYREAKRTAQVGCLTMFTYCYCTGICKWSMNDSEVATENFIEVEQAVSSFISARFDTGNLSIENQQPKMAFSPLVIQDFSADNQL